MRKLKLLIVMFLATFVAGTDRAFAQVNPQLSDGTTVYEYYMNFPHLNGGKMYARRNSTDGYVYNTSSTDATTHLKVKLVASATEDYVNIVPTNATGGNDYNFICAAGVAEGNNITFSSTATTNGDWALTYDETTKRCKLALKGGENHANGPQGLANGTSTSDRKLQLYRTTSSGDAHKHSDISFYPANANALGITLGVASGYYKIRNARQTTMYLRNDYELNADNKTYKGVSGTKNNYIWKVDVDELCFTITNGQGTPIKVDNTAWSSMLVVSKPADKTYVFDNYIHCQNDGDDKQIMTYSSGGTGDEGSHWVFEPVTTGTAYRVEAPEGVMVTYTVGDVKNKAFNGGFFMCESTPVVTDFKIEADDGYGTNVVVDATNHIIKVRCTIIPDETAIYVIKNKGTNRFAEYRDETPLRYTGNSGLICEQGMFFKIAGDSINGYTIRVAKNLTQYVYNNNNSEVGVTTTDGDNCKWIISKQGDGWNINPMAGGGSSWNVNTSGNKIAYWSDHDTHDNNIWYLTTAHDYAVDNTPAESTVIGSFTGHQADAIAAADALTEKFSDESYTAFESQLGGGKLVVPTNGWYKIKNKDLDKYLFSESNDNPKNITYVNDGGDNAKYYWYVTFDGSNATIKGTTGKSMARTAGNYGYYGGGTTYISPITLEPADPDDNGEATWTEGYFLFRNFHSSNQSHLTRYNEGYNSETNPIVVIGYNSTGGGNQYTFEPVEVDENNVYTVVTSGFPENTDVLVTYNVGGYTGNATVYNGGKYILETAPASADFTVSFNPHFTTVTVEGNTISVVYEEKTTYVPLKRATSIEVGKTYMIYNATVKATGETVTTDYTGFVQNVNGSVHLEKSKPTAFAPMDKNALWTVEETDGKQYLKSLADNKYVGATGVLSAEKQEINIDGYTGESVKKLGSQFGFRVELEDGTLGDITEGHNLYALHNGTNGWNGTENGQEFNNASEAYMPFAFYEVGEYSAENLVVYNEAKETVAKEGKIGYPKTGNTIGAEVKKLLSTDPTTEGWATNLQTKIADYKAITDVVMPENGKAYKIYAQYASRTAQPLYFNGTRITARDEAEIADPNSMIFICRKMENDKYVLVNNAGKYLVWCDSDDGGKSVNINGYTDIYEEKNQWTISHAEHEGTHYWGNFLMVGTGKNNNSYYLIPRWEGEKKDCAFISSDALAWWYDGAGENGGKERTPLFTIEEVPDYRNKISFTRLNDKNYWVATYSAPYPTKLPAGVTAYAVTSTSTDDATTWSLQGTDTGAGLAIPANEGVLLAATTSIDPLLMVPATTETAQTLPEGEENLLKPTPYTVTEDNSTAFILASVNGEVGFYLANAGTVGSYRACLELPSEANIRSLRIKFGDEATGIDGVAQPVNGSGTVYDLSGRAVAKPVKGGFYIKNGVKFIQK